MKSHAADVSSVSARTCARLPAVPKKASLGPSPAEPSGSYLRRAPSPLRSRSVLARARNSRAEDELVQTDLYGLLNIEKDAPLEDVKAVRFLLRKLVVLFLSDARLIRAPALSLSC